MELLSDPIVIEDELPMKKNIGGLNNIGVIGGLDSINRLDNFSFSYLWIAFFILIIIIVIWKFNKTKIDNVTNVGLSRFNFKE